MLTYHRKPVCLSLISTDLPVWSVVEAAATLYQKDHERFHLLLSTPPVKNCEAVDNLPCTQNTSQQQGNVQAPSTPRILWLEISPYRVIMTMQGNDQLSYRHYWEQGVYGVTRYWLPGESLQLSQAIRLRNYTRSLTVNGRPLPKHLRVEYELWTGKVQLGSYILSLEVKH
ncbi:hypothetical protein [Scytonema sp. PCC 10023]|uniref:hypothetical protein n=1 Tax=Scytonema sp. PCC 10023 TaxID=1680591 RepID=UPI0039C75EF8